jgi:hypothetical protein
MHVKKLAATIAVVGAFAGGGLAIASPAQAGEVPVAMRVVAQAPDVVTPHWVVQGSYKTPVACNAEGAYIVAHDSRMTMYRCLWGVDEDIYILETFYDPL